MLRQSILRLLLLSTIFFVSAATLPADDKEQIADLEKKLADLQKKLVELKKQNPTAVTAKKALTIKDADSWRSIRTAILSNDGKWFAHRVGPAEGDGEVILRNVADSKETKYPAGAGFGQLQFSFDSKWVTFSVTPYVKPGGSPSAPRPKSKLVLVNLANMEKTELEGVSSCEFAGEGATHIAYRKSGDGAPSARPGFGPPGQPTPTTTAPEPTGHTGTDLVLRRLNDGLEVVFGNVAEYSFNKPGTWLVTTIDAVGQTGNGVYLHDLKTGALYPVESAKAGYRNISWNEDRTAFAVTKSVEDAGYEGKWLSILGFTNLGPTPTKTAYDPKGDKDFPAGFVISNNRIPSWNDALDTFVFGIAERKKKDDGKEAATTTAAKTEEKKEEPKKKDEPKKDEPKKEEAAPSKSAATSTGPKPELVIWHWKDERLQPMQALQATTDKMHTFAAEYRVKEKKFIRLADDAVKTVSPGPKQRYAIGRDVKPYEYMSNLDGRRYADIYVTDLLNGTRKKVLTKSQYVLTTSPTGTQFLYYEDGHFFVYDMAAGKSVNLTKSITGTAFVNDEDDHNISKPPHQAMGWSRDGTTIILSDGWDLWAVKTDGSGGKNLTGNGKTDQIRYQGITQYEMEPKPGYDFTKPFYVTMYGEWTKKGGIGRIEPNTTGVKQLLWGDYSYGLPIKARQADVFAYSRQSAIESPDYYLTDASFKEAKKVTDSNPQQKDYLWCPGVKIVDYTGTAGKKLQGTLYLPANYEAGKAYPTVIYIYEKLTQGTNQYTPPSFRGGFNKSIYTSNGYAVFTPDITYRINDPGKSSIECILPGLDAAIATTVVDGSKVGLHGHSWGGYQTAFAITQTKRFACAIAGAPLTDLISMYSSVYWNSGSANQPIFESSQGRFTAGYWDQQEAYIRNSPVYYAKNVVTPLLLLHNDKDGAVDFTQGVEYYNTLRRLQKPVVMLQYKGENHGLAKTENQKDYAVRMREFFDHYLMGKPAPAWWQEGVPHLKMDEHLKTRK